MDCIKRITACLFSVVVLASCSNKKDGFFYGSMGLGNPLIIVAHSSVGIYANDIEGNFQKFLADYSYYGLSPRALAPINTLTFAVVLSGTNMVGTVDLLGQRTDFIVGSTDLSGNLYHSRIRAGELFVIKDNQIESFSRTGTRVGSPRVATTIGSCVLSVPRGMTFTADGKLVVVGTGNPDAINIYDVSDPADTKCVARNVSLGDVNPVAVIAHSNGKLYVATQNNTNQVYEVNGDGSGNATAIFSNNSIINNPTALLELPDQNILVSSHNPYTIEKITVGGTRVGSNAFMKNLFPIAGTFIVDMTLMGD